jgi:hypothetical protein
MVPITIATEDELSEAIASRLVSEVPGPCYVAQPLRKGGFGYLRSRMANWRQMAERQVVFVLTDLDRVECPVAMRNDWAGLKPLPPRLLFRIAVREVESWVLADHDAIRRLMGAVPNLPDAPDDIPDPKQALLKLAKKAPRSVRDDIVRQGERGNLLQGLGYNTRLVNWVNSEWSPKRAAERSPSLARARKRLSEIMG